MGWNRPQASEKISTLACCKTTRSTFGGREPNIASISASADDKEDSTEKQEFIGMSSSSSGYGLNALTSLAFRARNSTNVPALPPAPAPKVACGRK